MVINTSWLWEMKSKQQPQGQSWPGPSTDDWLCLWKGNKTIHQAPNAGGSQSKNAWKYFI